MSTGPVPFGRDHLVALFEPLARLEDELDRINGWGRRLAGILRGGGRLLAVGNGGSAAQAQHLTSELVGRYRDDRPPFSALALHAESSTMTAIGNDYGYDECFARQVRAHGRRGDVLVALSTSGRSPNILAAVVAAREVGLAVWGLTGPPPNPLSEAADEAVCIVGSTATVQEVHQVAVHLLCAAFEVALTDVQAEAARPGPVSRPTRASTGRAGCGPLVVVGDALLDCDLDGWVERLCPDAPVPVVDDPTRCARPGGAALAAAIAASASGGDRVVLVTAFGEDDAGRELTALVERAGVEVVDLGLAGATPQKVRVRSAGRTLIRLDHGGPRSDIGAVSDAARRVVAEAGAVLVSDYGRGITGEDSVRGLLGGLRTPVVWDPHPRGAPPTPGARLVTPNRSEAELLAGQVAGDGLSGLTARARALARRWDAAGVVVTLGPDGAVLVEGDGLPLMVRAVAVTGGDPCGAGDCFAATAAARLATGALPSEAVVDAVRAASAFVAAGGAAAFSSGAMTSRDPQIDVREAEAARPSDGCSGYRTDWGAADALVRAVRVRGGTVVATGGCFDLLHAGHVRSLEAARALGDCLIVCLNSDRSVRRIKGPDRPLVGEADRAAVLAALGVVDAVVLFDEDTPAQILSQLRPDLFAKGGDYRLDDLPEAPLLATWGGQAVVLPYVEGRSTTRILEEAIRRGTT